MNTIMLRFLTIIAVMATCLGVTSCARMDKYGARYNPEQCPFCSMEKGVCSYCHGTKKCNLCNGTGKRFTAAPSIESEDVKKSSYTETCPYCKGTGKCRYCDATGTCWACKGSGQAGDWDFYSRFKKLKEIELAYVLTPDSSQSAAAAVPAPAKGK
jgi:RecJ-like exonuclease